MLTRSEGDKGMELVLVFLTTSEETATMVDWRRTGADEGTGRNSRPDPRKGEVGLLKGLFVVRWRG